MICSVHYNSESIPEARWWGSLVSSGRDVSIRQLYDPRARVVWFRFKFMPFAPSNFSRLTFRARKNAQQLAQRIGVTQAQNELRWMREASGNGQASSPASFERMLARRVRGEPLQYILGPS